MFTTLIRRTGLEKAPFANITRYKSKKVWPPDFSKLNAKQQFRFERKLKRRSKLKWARPRWVKGVKIAQLSSILIVMVYGVLFMDLSAQDSRNGPFCSIRSWFFGLTGDLFNPETYRRDKQDTRSAQIMSSGK